MNNLEKYNEVFINCFGVSEDVLNDNLEYNTIEAWDSVGHMTLVAEIEAKFDIQFEMDEIIDFSSYEKGKEIVSGYGISFE